ncbi:hypothetical protein [Methanobacterium sp.]|uniref:hypothetical protein n=1 Tax=Methanobacterium sp. TaxID=2164 RepID=UPI002ABBB639|nr:hypothetical protein [Methanobacterium sp.]MDY9923240.1 hypothetical protein [Methanobacterium sp.]
MPDLGPLGRGGARRRTRKRMTAVNERSNEQQGEQGQPETVAQPDNSDKLEKLAKLLKDKGVISETEYNLIFG